MVFSKAGDCNNQKQLSNFFKVETKINAKNRKDNSRQRGKNSNKPITKARNNPKRKNGY